MSKLPFRAQSGSNHGGDGGSSSRALNDEQRKAANARYHEVRAENPELRVTPVRKKVGKEFGVSLSTIRRIVEEYANKK